MALDDNISALATAIGTEIKSKQDILVSGTNIKTVNGTELLGSGNLEITVSSITGLQGVLDDKASTTDLASKEISANKKTDMETNKLSDDFYPSIKAVYDWAKGLFVTNQALSAALAAKFNLRDVVQVIGSDGSKVMSQKASTEAFYRAGPGVVKAGKIYVQSTEPTENVEEGDIWLKI